MQDALKGLVGPLFTVLSAASPLAKAVSAGGTLLVTSLINMAFAGSFDTTSIVTLAAGLLVTAIVYVVPNKTAKVVVAATASAAEAAASSSAAKVTAGNTGTTK